jgi:RNA polymerase sigma-70 factor (ECF subfamily)
MVTNGFERGRPLIRKGMHLLRMRKDTGTGADSAANDEARTAERFTELYEYHFDFVWRTVRLLGTAAENTDDAVQDVFLVAHRRLGDFEARASARTWLFAIALRVVSDHRRSRKRRLRLLERMRDVDHMSGESPLDAAVSAQTRQQLMAALDSLPEEQRVVFALTELEEMSAPEIAAALQVNLNTVYTRLRSARRHVLQKLREVLAGGGP